jgi:hypothetical protein
MNRLNKYAEHFIKLEFMKANIEVFQNESGREGVNFIIKTNEGNYHELFLHSFELEKETNIRVSKDRFNEAKGNIWLALVMVTKNQDCSIYLIPSTILLKTKVYKFLNQSIHKESYLEINVFMEAIPELSQFSFNNVVSQL